jgi:hypothetical protein
MSANIYLPECRVKRGISKLPGMGPEWVQNGSETVWNGINKTPASIGYFFQKESYTHCNLGLAIFLRLCFNVSNGKAREVIGHLRNEPVTGSDTWTANNIKLSVCTRVLYTYKGTGAHRQTVRLLLFLFKKLSNERK